jgi:hypothetical protein
MFVSLTYIETYAVHFLNVSEIYVKYAFAKGTWSDLVLIYSVNTILEGLNIERQTTVSKGEVAYLLMDISDVKEDMLKDIYASLESSEGKRTTLCPHVC